MPLIALEASQLILLAITAAVGALAFWLVGHTVEKDVDAIGANVPKILSPLTVIAVVAIAFFVTHRR